VTFHVEDKLRTVLWQWADDELTDQELQSLRKAKQLLACELGEQLKPFLKQDEIDAISMRVDRLLSEGRFPLPNPNWPAIPWPAF
jgi:uncharacterized repeat protein (TIGR03843 family)